MYDTVSLHVLKVNDLRDRHPSSRIGLPGSIRLEQFTFYLSFVFNNYFSYLQN